MSANSDQDDTVSRTSSESARSTPVEDPALLESSDEDDDDYLPSAPQTDTGNDEDEMEAVDDEVAGDGAQEENTVGVEDGAAGEDAQEEEVDELQESGNEEALPETRHGSPEKAGTSPGKPTKQALLLKGNDRCQYCDVTDIDVCVVPINKAKAQSQRCCLCNARKQTCTSFKTVDIVKKHPESTWLGLQEAKEEWSDITGRDVSELERADKDVRSKKGKGRTHSKGAGKRKGGGEASKQVPTKVNTPGRRQSGRVQAMKRRPADEEDGDDAVAASPSKRTRTLPPRNATPGPSGARDASPEDTPADEDEARVSPATSEADRANISSAGSNAHNNDNAEGLDHLMLDDGIHSPTVSQGARGNCDVTSMPERSVQQVAPVGPTAVSRGRASTTGLSLGSAMQPFIRASVARGSPVQQRMLRMLQALRAEALARQYSVNAELQRLDDMILTLENDVEEGNAEANADVDMAEGSSGGRA